MLTLCVLSTIGITARATEKAIEPGGSPLQRLAVLAIGCSPIAVIWILYARIP